MINAVDLLLGTGLLVLFLGYLFLEASAFRAIVRRFRRPRENPRARG